MKHAIGFLILASVFILSSCSQGDHSKSTPEKPTKNQKEIIDSIPEEVEPEPVQFSEENWQRYTDSLMGYWSDRIIETPDYHWKIDTIAEDNYVKYDYRAFRRNHRNSLIQIETYEFKTDQEATDFYNDLKTQEFIVPFGLNKRPNHIVVDGKKVFWHHMEHPYGHRMEELNAIFSKAFNFRPTSKNLDSVSGFNYCQCYNEDPSMEQFRGKWKVEAPIKIVDKKPRYDRSGTERPPGMCDFSESNGFELTIVKDSLKIGEEWFGYHVNRSIELPDNRYYWKYLYPSDSIPHFTSDKLNSEFLERIAPLRKYKKPIWTYSVYVKDHCDFDFLVIEGVGVFCERKNGFSKMKRR